LGAFSGRCGLARPFQHKDIFRRWAKIKALEEAKNSYYKKEGPF